MHYLTRRVVLFYVVRIFKLLLLFQFGSPFKHQFIFKFLFNFSCYLTPHWSGVKCEKKRNYIRRNKKRVFYPILSLYLLVLLLVYCFMSKNLIMNKDIISKKIYIFNSICIFISSLQLISLFKICYAFNLIN